MTDGTVTASTTLSKDGLAVGDTSVTSEKVAVGKSSLTSDTLTVDGIKLASQSTTERGLITLDNVAQGDIPNLLTKQLPVLSCILLKRKLTTIQLQSA
mgnify:CR=1 FL=1